MKRRNTLRAAILAGAMLLASPAILQAQEFTQTVRIVVPNAPGGTSEHPGPADRPVAGPRDRAIRGD